MIRHNGIVIDRATRTITVGGAIYKFYQHNSTSFKGISALLLAGPVGLTREQLYDAVHGNCPDGGTIGGPHDVHVWLGQAWKSTIAELGLTIHRRKAYGTNRMVYSLHVV